MDTHKWKTSDFGEKIICIRRMNIHHKNDLIQTNLYISKYPQKSFEYKAIEFFGEDYYMNNNEIQPVIDRIKMILRYLKLTVI